MVVEGMWQVVNQPGGTGGAMQMAGFDVAGKTGTAQVVSLGKDVGANKDHSWFVAYAPAWKPEIVSVALIENVGFGGRFAAPATRAVYEEYYRKTRGTEPPGAQIAAKKDQAAAGTASDAEVLRSNADAPARPAPSQSPSPQPRPAGR
jgi:penicillin-binding protein 2